MAAVVQTQLRKVEEKLKPALYNTVGSDYWAIAEKKTTLKREQLALGIYFFRIQITITLH